MWKTVLPLWTVWGPELHPTDRLAVSVPRPIGRIVPTMSRPELRLADSSVVCYPLVELSLDLRPNHLQGRCEIGNVVSWYASLSAGCACRPCCVLTCVPPTYLPDVVSWYALACLPLIHGQDTFLFCGCSTQYRTGSSLTFNSLYLINILRV